MNGTYSIGEVVLSNWIIKNKLGEGSYGKVYEIERKDFGETYTAALKIITVPQSEAEIQAAIDEGMSSVEAKRYFYSMVEDIVREFALMARVKGTAYVVGYEDHMVIPHEKGIGWDILIRMEKLTPLLTYAYSHPFSRRNIIQLGIHICSALEVCQKYNIIHRDIKPENIFVSENGDFKLGDFGIARMIEKTVSGLSKKGTYTYMAPEVYKGIEYGFNVDMYSLGIVLYRMLNKNRVPFLPHPPEPITYSLREKALVQRMSGVPLERPFYGEGRLGEIVLKATAYDPRERYSSPMQMRQELEAILYQEEDGPFIYPEGDELVINENVYVSGSLNRKIEYRDEMHLEESEVEDSTCGIFDRNNEQDTDSAADEGDATISVFSGNEPRKVVSNKKKYKLVIAIVVATLVVIAVVTATGIIVVKNREQAEMSAEIAETEETILTYEEMYTQAEEFLATDASKAVEKMREALEIWPDESRSKVDYSYILYKAGEYDDCISYIETDLVLGKTMETEVQDQLMEILGAAYYEKEDYAAAASFFRISAAGVEEMKESVMRDYAVCLGRLGSLEEAKNVLNQMRIAGANSYATQYVEAEIYYDSEDYQSAAEEFTEVMDFCPDEELRLRAFRSLSRLYRDCADLEASGEYTVFYGEAALKQIETLENGIEKYHLEYDSSLYEMLGMAYYEAYMLNPEVGTEYLKNAAQSFKKVQDMGIQKQYFYTNLYSVYYEMKDYSGAEEILSDMEEVYPSDYLPHALRAILLIDQENQKEQDERNYEKAVEEYEKAGSMLKSFDDTSYYQQIESLIQELKENGWL